MNKSLAILVVLAVFAFLSMGSVASAQSPDGAAHDRVQQQRAPAACPPDIQWGCVLSGSTSPGLSLNSTSTANNATSLYASLNNPGNASAAVWGRVLGAGSKGYGVYGSHQGSGYGVYGFSNYGIGFLGFSNTGTGMQGETFSTGDRPGILGQHRATSGTGAGVEGRTNSASEGAAGVLGVATSTSTTYHTSAGVRGINNSNDGYGVHGSSSGGAGVHGFSSSAIGVYGYSGGGSDGYGVYGYSPSGTGVYGTSDGTVASYGVHGVSVSGRGVYGKSENGDGVYGYSTNGTGVYGFSFNGYSGWFGGDVLVTGDLTVRGSIVRPAGTTRLDHPLDPENQYLTHAFVESPDMKTVYDGNVTLDANGEALVELPSYVQALNRDFRYQLTAVGTPGPNLYIAQKLENNRFKIAGGAPGMEVSWEVTGIRQDVWANENRTPVEEPKPADERGTYLYPEGYGQPESRGVNYEHEQRAREMQDAAPAPAEVPGQ
jgi:hypothetical protein